MTQNLKIKNSQLVSQGEGNIVSDMDGEKVMLSIHNGKYYNLGQLGGEIWDLIKEPISVQELIDKLLLTYDVEPSECEEQATNFLSQLFVEGLIQIEN